MQQNIPLKNLYDAINVDFFMRIVLASLEIICLLRSQNAILHESFGKGAGGDNSSGADLLAEAIFCKFLLPRYHIDSEEAGFIKSNEYARGTVILDPLDGSSNFKSNIPYYGASIALCDKDGKVREAAVVNFISQEISYSNDTLFSMTKIPCVFRVNTIGSISFNDLFKKQDSKQYILDSNNQAVWHTLQYQIIDFSPLLDTQFHEKQTKNARITLIRDVCATITATQKYLPRFTFELLKNMFALQFVVYCPQYVYPMQILECGIFEKASYHQEWVAFLLKQKLKFRSLGATALSLGFSFRYLFVLLPSEVRKYDGMAGFYLAQNQIIHGNVMAYCDSIPILKRYSVTAEYVIIASESNVIDKILRR